jgi:hypothetical protein
MKKIFVTLFLLLATDAIWAQNTAIDKLFDKYAGKEGFTTVFISKYMFEMFNKLPDNSKEDKEFKDLTNRLTGIRILSAEGEHVNNGINFYKEIMNSLPQSEYKELMVIKETGQDVKFLVKEVNGKIVQLLLISGGSDNALICIDGDIDLKTISTLSKGMQIEGMENLEKVKE